MKERKTQVLIVGAGPVGLSASLLLADQGVRSIVVEKRPTTSNHPKASYFNTRTMEILRQIGVADDVYAGGAMPAGVAFYTSLTGYNLGNIADDELMQTHVENVRRSTASPGCVSSQIVLEAIFREHADEHPAIDVLFSHECVKAGQDDTSAYAIVRDRENDEDIQITADYIIACDGARSTIRTQCGRELIGPPQFGRMINVYIEADIESLVDEKHQGLYWISRPDASGVFIGLGGDWQKWCYNFYCDEENGERVEDFTEERCIERIHRALGTTKLPIKVLAAGPWDMCGQVIDCYKDGRILFGGDAAHLTLPTGGFGFNTGMQEIHNLAWKLAAVLNGAAGEALLDTYHDERRAIAVYNVEVSTKNAANIQATGAVLGPSAADVNDIDLDTPEGAAQRAKLSAAIRDQRTHFLFLGQEVGFGYWESPIITPDGTLHYAEEHHISDPVFTYIPNGRPGARAPHLPLAPKGNGSAAVSTHDLVHGGFTCLISGAKKVWQAAAEQPSAPLPVRYISIGQDNEEVDFVDVDSVFEERYGLQKGGAVLVRPDGHIAWRSTGLPDKNAESDLQSALNRSLCR